MQKLDKYAQTFSVVLTLVVVGMSLGAFILIAHGTKFLSVQSGSMVPTFSRGDLVIDSPVTSTHLAVGDVVTYTNPAYLKGQPITHRLVQTGSFGNGQHFITKGDANTAADPPITAKNIVGKVSHSLPYLGYGFDFVRKPLGLALLIYLPALLIVLAEMRRLISYYKDQEPYVVAGYRPAARQLQPAVPQAQTISYTRGGLKATKASAILTVPILAIAVFMSAPLVQAALASSARLTPNTISTFVKADHLVIYQVGFSNGVSGTCLPSGSGAFVYSSSSSSSVVAAAGCHITGIGSGANVNSADTIVSTGGGAFIGSGSSGSGSSINGLNQTVTIYNPTTKVIDLTGYKLTDNNITRTIANGAINARSYFVYTWPIYNGLARGGDRMILRDVSSTGIDSLSWGSDISQLNPSIAVQSATVTLTRKAPALDTNTASDWLIAP